MCMYSMCLYVSCVSHASQWKMHNFKDERSSLKTTLFNSNIKNSSQSALVMVLIPIKWFQSDKSRNNCIPWVFLICSFVGQIPLVVPLSLSSVLTTRKTVSLVLHWTPKQVVQHYQNCTEFNCSDIIWSTSTRQKLVQYFSLHNSSLSSASDFITLRANMVILHITFPSLCRTLHWLTLIS